MDSHPELYSPTPTRFVDTLARGRTSGIDSGAACRQDSYASVAKSILSGIDEAVALRCRNKPFQVAIVGGGVCGLACAVALQRAGVPVEVFEAAAAFTEVGAGIGLGPNAIRVLKAIGVLDEVLKKTNPAELKPKGFRFYSGLEGHELVYQYPIYPEDASLSMHRAAFLDALVGAVDPRTTHFNKRCTSISDSPTNPARVIVHFADGSTQEADVVLGADGIRSTVRDYVLGEVGKSVAFSNTVAYRFLIPHAALKAAGFKTDVSDTPACFMGPSKHIIVVPIKNGELINVAAFAARYDVPIGSQLLPEGSRWVEEVGREEMQKEYDGWGPDVTALLRCMPERASRWSVHIVYPPLESYAKGHVALLGDAAHGMLPHLGAGAGQGLEDAYVLAGLLSHPEASVGNIEAVLRTYSQTRRPRAQDVWDASLRAGMTYDFHGQQGSTVHALRGELQDLWTPVWHYNLDGDLASAISLLHQIGAFKTREAAET
ncbi:FAD/NAD(P)-binding domain-containing protein [Pilatotrama ljubarskyi]|nr:FAD/NAD(P)-binding domain-containing protein [Pilatotrama ljubarskyi]